MKAQLYNGLTLAYIGDSIFELKVREYVLSLGFTKVDDLHKKVVSYTKGEQQAVAMRYLLEHNVLTEEEISYYKRGRNSHVNLSRKNIKRNVYLEATGFEALIGYLYLSEQLDRLEELVQISLTIIN